MSAVPAPVTVFAYQAGINEHNKVSASANDLFNDIKGGLKDKIKWSNVVLSAAKGMSYVYGADQETEADISLVFVPDGETSRNSWQRDVDTNGASAASIVFFECSDDQSAQGLLESKRTKATSFAIPITGELTPWRAVFVVPRVGDAGRHTFFYRNQKSGFVKTESILRVFKDVGLQLIANIKDINTITSSLAVIDRQTALNPPSTQNLIDRLTYPLRSTTDSVITELVYHQVGSRRTGDKGQSSSTAIDATTPLASTRLEELIDLPVGVRLVPFNEDRARSMGATSLLLRVLYIQLPMSKSAFDDFKKAGERGSISEHVMIFTVIVIQPYEQVPISDVADLVSKCTELYGSLHVIIDRTEADDGARWNELWLTALNRCNTNRYLSTVKEVTQVEFRKSMTNIHDVFKSNKTTTDMLAKAWFNNISTTTK